MDRAQHCSWVPMHSWIFFTSLFGLQVDGIITSAAWDCGGGRLALGLEDGRVSLRDASGLELSMVQADSRAPVACISYSPTRWVGYRV